MKYKIGDVARILGVSPDILRYYEKKGVVTPMKGENNDYAAPLVKELPKHSDAANRTAGTILDIIVKLGRKTEDDEDQFNCD